MNLQKEWYTTEFSEIIKLLLAYDYEEYWSELQKVVFYNDIETCKKLLKNYANINDDLTLPFCEISEISETSQAYQIIQLPLLLYAFGNNFSEIVKLLLTSSYGLQMDYKILSNDFLKGAHEANYVKMFSTLLDFFPMRISFLLSDEGESCKENKTIKTVLIDSELNEQQINQIPSHIKTLSYEKHISEECLALLRAKGFELNYSEIEMPIDPKYLGGRISNNDSAPNRQAIERQSELGIYEHSKEDRIEVNFKKLSELRGLENSGPFNSDDNEGSNEPYSLVSNTLIKETDKVMFVFAGRKENAYLPPVTDGSRCVIVLTQDEYNALQIPTESFLSNNYDFLILAPRNKKDHAGNDIEVKVGKLIERRRAALFISREFSLKKVIFMDDNVLETCFSLPEEDSTDSLFDFMATKMLVSKEPILSISTYSRLNKSQAQNQPGCKIWMIDFEKFNTTFPNDFIDVLMPYNESACSEDYRLQVISHVFFANEEEGVFGYQVLPASQIQLKRTTGQKSTNAKAGMLLTPYNDEDDLHPKTREQLTQQNPNFILKFNRAHHIFNEKIQIAINEYNQKFEARKRYDRTPEKITSTDLSEVPGFTPSNNFMENFIGILDQALGNNRAFSYQDPNENTVKLYPHQNEGLEWLLTFLAQNDRKDIIFNLATGAGKTLLMLCIALAAFASDSNQNVMLIFPSVELVLQTQQDLLTKYVALLSYFQIEKSSILGVCSNNGKTINNIVQANQLMDENLTCKKAKIYLFCVISLTSIISTAQKTEPVNNIENNRTENTKTLLANTQTLIFDEVHLQKKLRKEAYLSRQSPLFFDFSATPDFSNSPKSNRWERLDNEFQYLRQTAIENKCLPPVYVDQTLPQSCSHDSIATLLSTQVHPNGQPLRKHKGIIYVKNQEEALALYQHLKQQVQQPDDFLSLIYSGVETNNDDKRTAQDRINDFKTQSFGLAIVVNMCKTGFDDVFVDYVIINRLQNSDTLHQEVGRALRKDKHNIHKIGYAIISDANEQTEKTIFPTNIIACLEEVRKKTPSVRETLMNTKTKKKRLYDEEYQKGSDETSHKKANQGQDERSANPGETSQYRLFNSKPGKRVAAALGLQSECRSKNARATSP